MAAHIFFKIHLQYLTVTLIRILPDLHGARFDQQVFLLQYCGRPFSHGQLVVNEMPLSRILIEWNGGPKHHYYFNDERGKSHGLFQESTQLSVRHPVSSYIFRYVMDHHPLWGHGELQYFVYLDFLLKPFQ